MSKKRKRTEKANKRVNILPLLEYLYVDPKKWEFIVNLAKTYKVNLSDYLTRPVEDEITNLMECPHFIINR